MAAATTTTDDDDDDDVDDDDDFDRNNGDNENIRSDERVGGARHTLHENRPVVSGKNLEHRQDRLHAQSRPSPPHSTPRLDATVRRTHCRLSVSSVDVGGTTGSWSHDVSSIVTTGIQPKQQKTPSDDTDSAAYRSGCPTAGPGASSVFQRTL